MSEALKKSGKLGICQVCQMNEAKYKCPGCGSCSCSLPCIRKHKAVSGCNGIRNRSQMIPKESMDNLTVLSDYRFLEEIDHKLEDSLRNPLKKSIRKGKESFTELPFHLKKLKTEARKRETLLEFMPKHFSSHKENSSRYSFAEKKIRWHVKLIFPQADLSFTEENVDEDTLLVDILKKYMEPPNRLNDKPSDLSIEHLNKLSYYQSASYNRTSVLFQSKLCRFDKRFIEMKLSASLKDNLCNRKIVEYPVFYIVLKDHLDSYLERDCDSENEILENETSEPSELTEDFKNKLQVKSSTKNSSQKMSYFETFSDSSELSD